MLQSSSKILETSPLPSAMLRCDFKGMWLNNIEKGGEDERERNVTECFKVLSEIVGHGINFLDIYLYFC